MQKNHAIFAPQKITHTYKLVVNWLVSNYY